MQLTFGFCCGSIEKQENKVAYSCCETVQCCAKDLNSRDCCSDIQMVIEAQDFPGMERTEIPQVAISELFYSNIFRKEPIEGNIFLFKNKWSPPDQRHRQVYCVYQI